MRLLIPLLLLISPPAWTWSESTHRLIADIVWLELNPQQRGAAYQLLLQHPDFDNGFARFMPTDLPAHEQPRWVFRQAAAWPDVARDYREDDPKRYRAFNHSTWHYVNFPLWFDGDAQSRFEGQLTTNLSLDPNEGNSDRWNAPQAVASNIRIIADPGAAAADRALALSWLLHVVGDLHQPLHTVAIFGLPEMEVSGDRGGNSICVSGQGQTNNLHWLWDGVLFNGESIAVLERWSLRVVAGEYNALPEAPGIDVEDWIEEGVQLAADAVYPSAVRQQILSRIDGGDCDDPATGRISIDEEYMESARLVARRQVMLAARRLFKILGSPLRQTL